MRLAAEKLAWAAWEPKIAEGWWLSFWEVLLGADLGAQGQHDWWSAFSCMWIWSWSLPWWLSPALPLLMLSSPWKLTRAPAPKSSLLPLHSSRLPSRNFLSDSPVTFQTPLGSSGSHSCHGEADSSSGGPPSASFGGNLWVYLAMVALGCWGWVQGSSLIEPQVERRAESPLFTFSLNLAHLIESKMPSLLRSTTTLYAA